MARNRDLMNSEDIPKRFGQKRYRKAVLNEDPKTVVDSVKSGEARVGIPTRQPTTKLLSNSEQPTRLPPITDTERRVSISTRQPTSPIATKRMNLVAKAKQKIQGKAPVAARRVTPAVSLSNLARRPTLRTKR
jgi:hypothetical protein